MQNAEMNEWIYKQLTKLDYVIRDVEFTVMLHEGLPDVERALCHLRERCEDAARIVCKGRGHVQG